MLNTRKLIYLLPEVCFVAELSPSKKPHSFSIQSFRQINGQFMDDEEIVIENVSKLFRKLDPETYTLVLPDFLFTNTIIDINETTEEGVREYLLKKLLPSLGLAKETHQLETFILAQHQGKTKVQLSGLEKSILGPIFPIAEERGIVIDTICPLSWTLKSVISLEPSLSIVELGKHVYLAQHYIGIDQSVFFPTDELNNLTESVRTLKGAEPNLQTLYMLSSSEAEVYIKDHLKQQLPLQQLAEDDTNIDGLPAHVKTAIEAAARTLDIEDYPVPKFVLEAYVAPTKQNSKNDVIAASGSEEELVSRPFSLEENTPLPPPRPRVVEESLGEDDEPEEAPSLPPVVPIAAAPVMMATPGYANPIETELTEPEKIADELTHEIQETQFVDKEPMEETVHDNSDENLQSDSLAWPTSKLEPKAEPEYERPVRSNDAGYVRPRPIIRNKSATGSLFKMIGIMLVSFLIVVGVGVGVGYGWLKMSDSDTPVNQTLSPSPKASPVIAKQTPSTATSAGTTASGSAVTAGKDKLKILVVNATGVSGLAGKTKSALTTAGYKTVDTGNAKGKYEKGYYILTSKPELVSQLATDAKVTAGTTDVEKSVEDPTGKYDAVFVLNQQ